MADNQIQVNRYNQTAAAVPSPAATRQQASGASFASLLENAVNKSGAQKSTDMNEIFNRAAEEYHVPVNLLKAVAKAESGFDPDAVSGCGAQGVMQLMPSTARSLGVQNAFDAEQNIMGGAKYLSWMLDRYDGNPKLALAAYNAGSGNVAKYGGVPPFKETQNYVNRVLNYAGMNTDASENSPFAPEISALNSMDGSSSDSSGGELNPFYSPDSQGSAVSLDSMNTLSLLSALTGSSAGLSALSGKGMTNSAGGFSYDDYVSLLQLMVSEMQSNVTSSLTSGLAGDDSGGSSNSGLYPGTDYNNGVLI